MRACSRYWKPFDDTNVATTHSRATVEDHRPSSIGRADIQDMDSYVRRSVYLPTTHTRALKLISTNWPMFKARTSPRRFKLSPR